MCPRILKFNITDSCAESETCERKQSVEIIKLGILFAERS
jgi:hypothetical protein